MCYSQLIITMMQINEDRVRLSAAGLFNVGVHLIPSVSKYIDRPTLNLCHYCNSEFEFEVDRCCSDLHGHPSSKLIACTEENLKKQYRLIIGNQKIT